MFSGIISLPNTLSSDNILPMKVYSVTVTIIYN